jgi:hypothetical protein
MTIEFVTSTFPHFAPSGFPFVNYDELILLDVAERRGWAGRSVRKSKAQIKTN